MTSPIQYRIRQATIADARELARLRWDFSDQTDQTFEAFSRSFAAFVEQILATGLWTIWVAEQDRRIIGNIYVQRVLKVPRPRRPEAYFGFVTNVYVEPFARNQGIGSQLLRTIQEWARGQHIEFLILWPSEESVAFYQRAGFVRNVDILEYEVQQGR